MSGGLHDAAVAVDALVAAVAGEAVALVAPGLRVVAAEGRPVRVEPAQRRPTARAGRCRPAAIVAGVARFTCSRPSGCVRWQAPQRAVAAAPRACRCGSRGSSPSAAGRRASPSPPSRRCAWQISQPIAARRVQLVVELDVRARQRPRAAAGGRRRPASSRPARVDVAGVAARGACGPARTALAGWRAIDLVAAAARGLARDQVVARDRRRRRRCRGSSRRCAPSARGRA